jgi:L-lactate dehydrogenase complex protein LldF
VHAHIKAKQKNFNNPEHQVLMDSAALHYEKCRKNTTTLFEDYQLLKNRVLFLKYNSVKDLNVKLDTFSFNFTKNGGKIHWAESKEEALKIIFRIIKEKMAHKISKSNDQIMEELALKDEAFAKKITVLESDINALHNDLADVDYFWDLPVLKTGLREMLKSFQQKLKFETDTVEDSVDFLKSYLIQKSTQSDISISSADFLVSDIGAIINLDDSGSQSISQAFPEIKIMVAGIDSMLSSIKDLDNFLYLKSANSIDKVLPYRVNICTGLDRREKEKEIHLILLDNGRTEMIKSVKQRKIFHCLKCGNCKFVCPVYKVVGNDFYSTSETSVLGAIKNPLTQKDDLAFAESFACTMCRRCTEVCPMQIPLHQLLLNNRQIAMERNLVLSSSEKKKIRKLFLTRKNFESSLTAAMLRFKYKKSLEENKIFPNPAEKTFSRWWKESQTPE